MTASSLTNAGSLTWSGGTINVGTGSLTNAGSLTLTGSGTQYLNGFYGSSNSLINQGTIVQAGPGTLSLLGGLSNSGDVSIAGTLTAAGDYTQTDGSTILEGGTLGEFNDNLNDGTLSGNGTVAANLNNTAGQVNPGGAGMAGVIAITGNYTQGDSGVLNIEIGGTGSGQFDRLTVSGPATLGGKLNVSLINFAPAAGDSFRFLTFNSRSGNFATQNLPSLGGGLQFSIVVNPNDLTLTVSPAALLSIALSPVNPTIAQGTTQQFGPIGTYSDNSKSDLSNQVTWVSADPSIASISNASGSQGLATGLAQGTTTISARLNGVTGTTQVTVSPAALVSIAVSPVNPTIAQGTTQQFTALGTYSDNSKSDLSNQVTWVSADPSIASISNASGSQGLATGLAGDDHHQRQAQRRHRHDPGDGQPRGPGLDRRQPGQPHHRPGDHAAVHRAGDLLR